LFCSIHLFHDNWKTEHKNVLLLLFWQSQGKHPKLFWWRAQELNGAFIEISLVASERKHANRWTDMTSQLYIKLMHLIQRITNTLRDEVLFKLGKELEVQQVIRCKGFFSYHSFHGLYILSNSVTSILHKTQVNIYNLFTHKHKHEIQDKERIISN